MRIAVFHDLPLGGPRRVANEQGKRLKKKHQIDLYILNDVVFAEEYKFFSKVYVFKFSDKNLKNANLPEKLYWYMRRIWKFFFLHKNISRSINRKKYDVVIVHSSLSLQAPFLLRFLKGKKIYYCQEISHALYDPVVKYRRSDRPLQFMYDTFTRFSEKIINKSNMKSADKILVSSKFLKREMTKHFKINSTVCSPGVDHKFFSPKEMRRDIDILFVGSIDYENGEYALFKNAIHFVDRKVKVKVIIGEKKWISDHELRDFYRKAKLVVCTAYKEPFGLVPLEAGACGTAVIAVNDGGYRETIIHNKTGYLVKRNPVEIGLAIGRVLRNELHLQEIGSRSRKNIDENWKWDIGIDRLELLLVKSASGNKN